MGSPPTRQDRDDGALPPLSDRRRSPRRRLRDRVASLDSTANPRLRGAPELQNQAALADDDLRQSALAMGHLEAWLLASMQLLEKPAVTAAELAAQARVDEVLEHIEALSENLKNLGRRMALLAGALPRR